MIVMFHVGRSGSSVLGGMLRRQRNVFWAGEVFRSHLEALGVAEEGFHPSQLEAAEPPDLTNLVRQSGPLYYGMEVKFFHLELFGLSVESYLKSLVDAGMTHLVILERKNYLEKIVSSIRAHDDGRYHVRKDDSAAPDLARVDLSGDIAIDYSSQSLLSHLDGYRDGFAQLRRAAATLGLSPLELSYEEHISADPSVAYRLVCDYVGIEPRRVDPELRQIRRGTIQSQISDLEAVRDRLAGTGYEWMLEA